jgi:hypothetical protein
VTCVRSHYFYNKGSWLFASTFEICWCEGLK